MAGGPTGVTPHSGQWPIAKTNSQNTVRMVGLEGALALGPACALQWYEPASVLEAAGSWRLLLDPSRSRAPFRYQEK